MSVVKVTEKNFQKEVMGSEVPVLVDFWAEWCGPCRSFSPIIEQFAEEHNEVKVCKVNVDEAQELAAKFEIMSIPTVMVFKDGKITGREVGVRTKQQLWEMI